MKPAFLAFALWFCFSVVSLCAQPSAPDSLTRVNHDPQTLEERRKGLELWLARGSACAKKHFPANIEKKTLAGDEAQLVVFEAMPHAYWYHFDFPETRETLSLMAGFFEKNLGH